VSWPARRAGPPPITGTTLAGAVAPGEGGGRDGRWVVGPAITGLGPACPPPPAAAHPVTRQLTRAQTAASKGSLRSRASGKPGTAVDLSPAQTRLARVPAGGQERVSRPARRQEPGLQAGSRGTVAAESTCR
jgi:hypothetical protein